MGFYEDFMGLYEDFMGFLGPRHIQTHHPVELTNWAGGQWLTESLDSPKSNGLKANSPDFLKSGHRDWGMLGMFGQTQISYVYIYIHSMYMYMYIYIYIHTICICKCIYIYTQYVYVYV